MRHLLGSPSCRTHLIALITWRTSRQDFCSSLNSAKDHFAVSSKLLFCKRQLYSHRHYIHPCPSSSLHCSRTLILANWAVSPSDLEPFLCFTSSSLTQLMLIFLQCRRNWSPKGAPTGCFFSILFYSFFVQGHFLSACLRQLKRFIH